MNFKILKKSKKSRARLGFLETSHGIVETPCLVPVATQAVIKTLESKEVEATKSQMLICNTFWLHLRGQEKNIEKTGSLHKFMNWKKPLMTDSAGFQVFSLGFGRDFGLDSKFSSTGESCSSDKPVLVGSKNSRPGPFQISLGDKPKNIKITHDGVIFRSPIDGREIFIGPKESIRIQESLGADIIFTFDECPPPASNKEYLKKSLEKTHRWAKICLQTKKSKQSLFGIVQGSKYKDLRIESAKFIGALDFDGFGIGGEFGSDKKEMKKMIEWVVDELPEKKPRHLLGVGHLEDIEKIIKAGVDTFDCTVPTHYARRGIAFTSKGRLNFNKAEFFKNDEPLDKNCICEVCLNYKQNYINHLIRAKEITGLKLLTFHNLWYFNTFIEEVRNKIKKGEI